MSVPLGSSLGSTMRQVKPHVEALQRSLSSAVQQQWSHTPATRPMIMDKIYMLTFYMFRQFESLPCWILSPVRSFDDPPDPLEIVKLCGLAKGGKGIKRRAKHSEDFFPRPMSIMS